MRVLLASLLLVMSARLGWADFGAAESALRVGDYGTAYEACKSDAEKGDAECQNLIGVLFRQGLGVTGNPGEAVRFFRRAADKKLASAEINLGLAYLNGLGVPQDAAQAARWFGLAAQQGDALGETQLALLLLTGRGVEKDTEKAVGLLKRGADRGYVPAQLVLAALFEAARRPMQAYVWYRVAERLTHEPVERMKATEGQSRTILQLSGQEIASAQNTARFWKPVGPPMLFGLLGARPAQPAEAASGELKPVATGSGFFVSREGDIVTNNHVVESCRETRVLRDGKPVPARIIATDAAADLALIRVPGPAPEVASFRTTGSARPGESIVVVGFPLQGLLTSDASVTTGIVSAVAGLHNDKKELQITAPVQPGNSGGPLLDQAGTVIGIVVGKLNGIKVAQATGAIPENINFAIHAELARALLDKNNIKYEAAASGEPLTTPAVAERALKYTVLVQCYR